MDSIRSLAAVLAAVLALAALARAAEPRRVSCYDYTGRAQRCIPPFVNAAFGLAVDATNTCGLRGPTEYCLQSSIGGALKQCSDCDARDPNRAHPPSYLTDFHSNDNSTWWQSDTMYEGMQYPTSVNLTLHLGKAFDITYVRLKFHSKRPESFAIYKRTREDGPWKPYQFYSATCEETYGRDRREVITRADETKAICTEEFSDISPLTGGSVAFSTLEGRPSAYDYENSMILQDWVTATDIKIVLTRMNTFGDEVFGDPTVLKSYFYSISDFAVGGRCKCNGHASECVRSTGQGLEEKLVCRCEHNTQGPNCDECQPFYNDRPWHRATATDAHECQACNCNGLSNRCFFDEDLFRRTGHGGHCLDCREYTSGPNCERCKDFYYRVSASSRCQPCNCDPVGSVTEQCDVSGQCRCKPGVTGEKCDQCQLNHYDFGSSGCRPCQCMEAGSRNNQPECVPDSGTCTCKEFVEGQNCDRCKPGYFGLNADNTLGCLACFCYGHSSVCTSAPGYTTKVVHSDFNSGMQKWRAEDRVGAEYTLEYNGVTQAVGVQAPGNVDAVYFVAPERYLGDQRFSYNQFLSFSLRIGEEGARASVFDVIIEGDGMRISAPIFAQKNPVPRIITQNYKLRLHEHANYQWMPVLSAMDFQKLLSNITSIKIRGTYTAGGVGFLDNVKLESARPGNGFDEVSHIEQCTCPDGYVGQFCESCAPGYHREPAGGGPLARCIPCNCNGHSDVCDVDDGRCICQHNTVGENCERCASGFYGYALAGTPDDCKPCPCPDNGPCVELLNDEVACINCKTGYVGNRCDMCEDGYFGDPVGKNGAARPCNKCTCNDNIDPNAVANCDTITGECLKCIYNTHGFYCDKCLPGYYGDALALPKGQCMACNCHESGSDSAGLPEGELVSCDRQTGQCPCLSNVIGKQCDMCLNGYWNIDSGTGCERCDCDTIGSFNRSCDISTGQCFCKPGVAGRKCDQCDANYYGFSREGCKACNCDPDGSEYLQCDEYTGQCACKENIEGRMCDRCMENKYNISAGCIDCPACYNLVQDAVNMHREKLDKLRDLISHIGDNPQAINDTDFRRKMKEVEDYVNDLYRDALAASGTDSSLTEQMAAMKAAVDDIMNKCGQISEDTIDAEFSSGNAKIDIEEAEKAIERAEEALRNSEVYIDTDGQEALRQAKEAQDKLGLQSNRMTEIAKEARELAEQHEEDANAIVDVADQALETSQEALQIATEALRKPYETENNIYDVRQDVSDADRMFEDTENLARTALQQSNEAYKESLTLLSEAESLVVPTVDTESLISDAQDLKSQASDVAVEADELMNENRQLMEDVDRAVHEANKLLENGEKQQQVADELLADADQARGIAKDAVAKAEKTLEDAYKTLDTLKEFDEKVQQSKDEAEEALKKIPEIEGQIRDAEATTEQARLDLEDAEENAIIAEHMAKEAQNVAEMASEDAKKIREDSDATAARATAAKDDSDDLRDLVDIAEKRLEQYEQQALEDDTLSTQALDKANQAKISAKDSSQQVADALQAVNEILDKLGNLDDIDTTRLDELERNLNDAENELKNANIDDRYNVLLEARAQQAMWVKDYSMELIQLQADVQNVKQINETIPRQCFKRIVIEPTDPTG